MAGFAGKVMTVVCEVPGFRLTKICRHVCVRQNSSQVQYSLFWLKLRHCEIHPEPLTPDHDRLEFVQVHIR